MNYRCCTWFFLFFAFCTFIRVSSYEWIFMIVFQNKKMDFLGINKLQLRERTWSLVPLEDFFNWTKTFTQQVNVYSLSISFVIFKKEKNIKWCYPYPSMFLRNYWFSAFWLGFTENWNFFSCLILKLKIENVCIIEIKI